MKYMNKFYKYSGNHIMTVFVEKPLASSGSANNIGMEHQRIKTSKKMQYSGIHQQYVQNMII